MHDQLYRKGQTAQMAMYEAHKERREWDHAGGTPPVHSHYGQVCGLSVFGLRLSVTSVSSISVHSHYGQVC